MRLIIKGKQFKVPQDLAEFAEQKIRKFEKRMPANAVIDLLFYDDRGPRGGLDKICEITLVLPGEKKPKYFSERSDSFRKSVNLIQEKLERELRKYKEKKNY